MAQKPWQTVIFWTKSINSFISQSKKDWSLINSQDLFIMMIPKGVMIGAANDLRKKCVRGAEATIVIEEVEQ